MHLSSTTRLLSSLFLLCFFNKTAVAAVAAGGATTLQFPSPQFGTFADAVNAASPNDTIEVGAGIFDCDIGGLGVKITTSPLRIKGQGAAKTIFDCQEKGRFLLIDQDQITTQNNNDDVEIYLQGITIRRGVGKSGGAIFFSSSSSSNKHSTATILIVNDCLFEHNKAVGQGLLDGGGAIYLSPADSNTQIQLELGSSVFMSNNATQASGEGGGAVGIVFANSTRSGVVVQVSGGMFVNNTAPAGGGMLIVFNGDAASAVVNVIGGQFLGNHGWFNQEGGGGLVLVVNQNARDLVANFDGTYFASNVDEGGLGAGLLVLINGKTIGASLVFANLQFVNNFAPQGDGAGLDVYFNLETNNTVVTLTNGSFVNNTVTGEPQIGGGAVEIYYNSNAFNSTINVFNSEFIRNSAPVGGGGAGLQIFFNQFSTLSSIGVYGSNFIGNNALSGGGGGVLLYFYYNSRNTTIIFENCFVANNIASGGAGIRMYFGLESVHLSLSMSNLLIANNTVVAGNNGGGGGMSIEFGRGSRDALICLDGVHFGNNIAPTGGAFNLQATMVTQFQLQFINTVISNNTAKVSGGGGIAVFIFQSPSAPLKGLSLLISNSSLVGNTATSASGGGLSVILPSDEQIPGCSSCTVCSFEGDGDGSPCECENPLFNSYNLNFYCPLSVCGFGNNGMVCQVFLSNAYPSGQFIPFQYASSIAIDKSDIVGNKVSCRSCTGGGIYIQNGALTLRGVINVNDNFAGQTAAAINVLGTASVHVVGRLKVLNNQAGESGSSVVVSSQGSFTMTNATLEIALQSSSTPIIVGGEFALVSLSGIGRIETHNSSLINVTCPQGYRATDSSLGSVLAAVNNWASAVMTSDRSVKCTPCGDGFYSVESGGIEWSNIDNSINNGSNGNTLLRNLTCLPCPFGGVCSSGRNVVLASQGFWGMLFDPTSSSSSSSSSSSFSSSNSGLAKVTTTATAWNFTRCPKNYCCGNGQGGCLPRLVDVDGGGDNALEAACAIGRNASTPLCGSCLDGFSQNLRGGGCSEKGQCNDGKWAWVVGAIASIVFANLLLVGSSTKGRTERNRDDGDEKNGSNGGGGVRRGMETSWIAPCVLYFVQNISLIFEVVGSEPQVLIFIITSISNLHLSSSSSSSSSSWENVCVIEGLQTDEAIGLQLLFPGAIALGLFSVWICLKAASMVPFVKSRWEERVEEWLSRFGIAGLKLILLFYTSIASVTGTLLHCVDIYGGQGLRVVFRAGGVECYQGWQRGLWAIFALIVVPFPFVLTAAQRLIKRVQQQRRQRDSESSRHQSDNSVELSLHGIEQPYRKDRWFWPGVVLTRRLLIALVFSFEADPFVQTILMTVMFTVFLIVHLYAKPFRATSGNIVEGIALASLAGTSVCAIRAGTVLEIGFFASSTSGMETVSKDLGIIMSILFFLPLVAATIAIAWNIFSVLRWKMRRGEGFFSRTTTTDGLELSGVEELNSKGGYVKF